MSVLNKITHMAVAAAAALGASTAFAASYPVLGTEVGSTLDASVCYSCGKQLIFEYAGSSANPVLFTLTDLYVINADGTTSNDAQGYFMLEQGYLETKTYNTPFGPKTYEKARFLGAGTSVIFNKELLDEGESIKTMLTTGGLYRLSFVFNDPTCVNVTGNVADFKISTVPLPGTAMLFASSLIGAGLWRRRVSDKNR